jgi:hypothetical protein
MGAVGGIVGVVFGILWTMLAFWLTADAPFPLVHVIFPLFGVLFIVVGIMGVIYNARNATAQNRFSVMDVVDSQSEPDPLDPRSRATSSAAATKFCPKCGASLRADDAFCVKCGARVDR